jgi:hypothetical protein
MPCDLMQDNCEMMQWHAPAIGFGANISLRKCVGHTGMEKLQTIPARSVTASKCRNCSGCGKCKQLMPLTSPEGTGGGGCTAEVAATAEALRQARASRPNAADTARAAMQATGLGATSAALVECAVCHRRPGDPGVPATLKLCGRCHRIRYCSAECQKQDWKLGHKLLCKPLNPRSS